MMYKTREYPLFAACGLNCGLCPRYHTVGQSRCPGCAADGFLDAHPSCGVLSCCQRKGIEYCFDCDEYPCSKYDCADETDSFITHRNQFRDMDKAKRIGMDAYKTELDEKVRVLEELLTVYNDGRRKSYYCLAVNLLELHDIKTVLEQLGNMVQPGMPIKEKAATAVRLFEEMAQLRDISLKLRKKAK
jgi:hypothetical protein